MQELVRLTPGRVNNLIVNSRPSRHSEFRIRMEKILIEEAVCPLTSACKNLLTILNTIPVRDLILNLDRILTSNTSKSASSGPQ